MDEKTKFYKYVLLPEQYWNCTVAELPDKGSSSNEFGVPYKEVISDWVLNFKSKVRGKGLYLYGEYGVGKTCIGAILLKAGIYHGYAGMWLNFPMIQEYSINPDRYMFSNTMSMIERAYDTDLLFVDELLIEKNKHWPLGILESLIRTRHQNKKTTILASNSSPNDLVKTDLTRGLASILSEATSALQISGKKFRKV